MKKILTLLVSLFVFSLVFVSCDTGNSSSSPTPAPVVDGVSVSGTVSFPQIDSSVGLSLTISVLDSLQNGNVIATTTMTGISGTSSSYTISNVPTGSYYIMAYIFEGFSIKYSGIYMTPGYPTSPNVVVESSNLTNVNLPLI